MNCSRCGFENEQDAAFCSHCGAPLSVSAPQAGSAPQAEPAPQAGYVPPQGYNQQNYSQQSYAPQRYAPQSYPQQAAGYAPPKKKRTGLVIGLVAGGVALIGAAIAAYFLFFSGPAVKGLWVCEDRGWALRIEDSVLTEYSPAGTDKTSYTVRSGQGETMLSGGEASFTVEGDKMSLVDEETGEKYLFTREDSDADVEAVVAAGFRGLWSNEEQGAVIELGKKGALTVHAGDGESEGNYEFDLKSGSGTITLGEGEYSFTAGWDTLTVDTLGGFTRAEKDLDVAAFVQQYGVSPLLATWYETTGQYGSIAFEDDGTFALELYGQTATGTYTFDTATGTGTLTSDNSGETTDFSLLDGALTLEGMTYTQEYVEQPSAEDFYGSVEGTWVATQDDELALEFSSDGTVIFYSGGDGYGGTYTFNPVDLTGTMTLTDFPGVTDYTFSISGDTLYVGDFPYERMGDPATTAAPAGSLLGTWYDEAGEAGTLYFDKDGMALMDTHGVMYSGTYTFDEATGVGMITVQVEGDSTDIFVYVLNGVLYVDETVYTQDYVEQAS